MTSTTTATKNDTKGTSSPAVSFNIQQIRSQMTPEGVRRRTRAPSTFTKRTAENEVFILWLYAKHPELLHDPFRQRLEDISAEPDYSPLSHKKYYGKKALPERKADYLRKLLRQEISDCLGQLGSTPPVKTVIFDALCSDVQVFLEYITGRKKISGGLMKASVYKDYRSGLTFLFNRYRYTVPNRFDVDLSDCMKGVKRVANEARQLGDGNIFDGSRGLTFQLYKQFNKWFLELGTPEGIYAAAYSKLTLALACRGDSTGNVCTKHLHWEDDSLGIAFSHSKEEQLGDDPTKRLPRHCYCNPLHQESDLASDLFNHLAMHPEIIADKNGLLFPGSMDAQTERFSSVLKDVIKDKAKIIEKKYGFDPSDIGIHSWRKCAHTKLNCGSTCGPTSSASCLRGGHSLGGSKNVYVVQEKASDEYCGRILSDLPEHRAEFAASYPDFIPIDKEQSIEGGVSDAEYNARKVAVDSEVDDALNEIFGEDNLNAFPTVVPFLRVGLASHLIHRKAIDDLLPQTSKLRFTPLFTSAAILSLKKHVRIAMPWEDHYKYFSDATGLPPHVINYRYFEEVLAKLDGLPAQWDASLDARQFNGQISLPQMRAIIEKGPIFQNMAGDISTMKRLFEEGGVGTRQNNTPERDGHGCGGAYLHSDGKLHRVPPEWVFPHLSLQTMYIYWHCGDDQSKNTVSPMKYFDPKDVKHLGRRAQINLTEVRFLMGLIDKMAEANGKAPKRSMTRVEANAYYFAGQSGIDVNPKTPMGRHRNKGKLTWSTVLKLMQSKKRSTS